MQKRLNEHRETIQKYINMWIDIVYKMVYNKTNFSNWPMFSEENAWGIGNVYF